MKTWVKRVTMTAGAMALAAGFAGATIFAGEEGETTPTTSTDSAVEDPADPDAKEEVKTYQDVRLTKTLITPDTKAAVIPTMNFTFTFAGTFYPYTSTGAADAAETPATTPVPTIAPVTLTFTDPEMDQVTNGEAKLTKRSDILVAADQYKKSGVYRYVVTETPNTVENLNKNQVVTYDDETYTMNVYVTFDSTTGAPKVETTITNSADKKVDPTTTTKTIPGNDSTNIVEDVDHDASFNFENKYRVTRVNPGTDPAFKVTKKVDGNLADPTKKFNYTINIVGNDLTETEYDLIVVKDGNSETKKITVGTPQTFEIGNGDEAHIADMTAGVVVQVTETPADDYVAKFNTTFGDVKVTDSTAVTAEGTTTETANQVDYTNTFNVDDVSKTGILINNLPYIALIAVGVAGLGYYFYNKRRHA